MAKHRAEGCQSPEYRAELFQFGEYIGQEGFSQGVAIAMLGNLIDYWLKAYRTKRLDLDTAAEQAGRLVAQLDGSSLRNESLYYANTGVEGVDILGTNARGARNNAEFDLTGRAFATGLASNCALCVVHHKDIGISASHRNTVTIPDYVKFLKRLVADNEGQFTQSLYQNGVTASVPQSSLLSTVSQTVKEALSEFAKICPDEIPPDSGTIVALAGIKYLDEAQKKSVSDLFIRLLTQHPIFHNPKTPYVKRYVSPDTSHLGQTVGFIYGGPNNPNPDYRHISIYR